MFEGLLRLGKGVPLYSADESYVRVTLPLTTRGGFAVFVARETRAGHALDLDELLIFHAFLTTSVLDRWTVASVLQVDPDQGAARLAALRERGYLVVRGRGRSSTYSLRRDLSDLLRGRDATDAEMALEEEGAKMRMLAVLRERGRLTNTEARRLTGFNRVQVYRLLKALELEEKAQFIGRGRSAYIVPTRGKK